MRNFIRDEASSTAQQLEALKAVLRGAEYQAIRNLSAEELLS